ncbi:MAG TPA: Ig-like domain-containing protein [Longimicrobiaceae bacterium]
MPNSIFRGGLLLAALLASACDDGVGPPPPPPTLTITPSVHSIQVGETHRFTASFRDPGDPGGASPTILWASLDAAVATVSSDGTVLGVGPGMTRIIASAGSVADTSQIQVEAPPEGCDVAPVTMAVGQVRRFTGGAALDLCLQGGAEYALVAANATGGATTTLVSAEGVTAPVGPPSPSLAPSLNIAPLTRSTAREPLSVSFERELRRRERAQLSPAAARLARNGFRAAQAAAPLAEGDLMQLNASTDCQATSPRTGRIRYIGERSIIVADTANPGGGFTAQDYARFGMTYDTLLHQVVTSNFGSPAGMNGESRVVIFFTRAVNELTPADAEGVVGGFFWAGDLFPRASCAGSNEREMFYVLAPDPSGTINGNVRSVAYVQRSTAGTIAHELQHLINASRRIFVNDAPEWEESWLNEGLSHIAEELVFYRRMGLAPGQNLGPAQIAGTQERVDITVLYGISNLLRLDNYLKDVEAQGPFQDDDDLATRGASWQYLRYALDRKGGDQRALLRSLVDSHTAGLENLQAVLGVDPIAWFVDDVTGLYADDAVAAAATEFRHPSWQYRPVLDWAADGFRLKVRPLTQGLTTSLELEGWGTGYLRAAVTAGTVGKIHIGTGDAPPPPDLRLVLMRTR